jgi:hypothetical protein
MTPLEVFFATIAATGTLIAIWRVFDDVDIRRSSRSQERYTFFRDFESDLRSNPNMHSTQVKEGFKAAFGKLGENIEPKVVPYFLLLDDFRQCCEDYLISRGFLRTVGGTDNFRIVFSKWLVSAKYG